MKKKKGSAILRHSEKLLKRLLSWIKTTTFYIRLLRAIMSIAKKVNTRREWVYLSKLYDFYDIPLKNYIEITINNDFSKLQKEKTKRVESLDIVRISEISEKYTEIIGANNENIRLVININCNKYKIDMLQYAKSLMQSVVNYQKLQVADIIQGFGTTLTGKIDIDIQLIDAEIARTKLIFDRDMAEYNKLKSEFENQEKIGFDSYIDILTQMSEYYKYNISTDTLLCEFCSKYKFIEKSIERQRIKNEINGSRKN